MGFFMNSVSVSSGGGVPSEELETLKKEMETLKALVNGVDSKVVNLEETTVRYEVVK